MKLIFKKIATMNNYGVIYNSTVAAGVKLDLQDKTGSTALIYGIYDFN